MRIGLTGAPPSVERMIEQAERAEADGFSSLWYASAVGGDPLVAMAMAGRATSSIELGTSVLQTYTCHPVLQANRAASVAAGMGRAGFILGLGPSHRPAIEDAYGPLVRDPGAAHGRVRARPGAAAPRGDGGAPRGRVRRRPRGARVAPPPHGVADDLGPGPRMLRVAGALADGTILWMATARAVETHVAPRIAKAALTRAGRPAHRAGCRSVVSNDAGEARPPPPPCSPGTASCRTTAGSWTSVVPTGIGDAAIVGDEVSVTAQVTALADAGVTDFWAAFLPGRHGSEGEPPPDHGPTVVPAADDTLSDPLGPRSGHDDQRGRHGPGLRATGRDGHTPHAQRAAGARAGGAASTRRR